MRILTTLALLLSVAMAGSLARANDYEEPLGALASEQLRSLASDPKLIEAIRAQNERHAGLGQADIDKLDKDWRAQVGNSPAPLIEAVQGVDASGRLVEMRDESEGLFTEVFAMDNLGLNVAVSDVTSDYWQGDEAKWQKTFLVGADAVHISDVELDESTQTYQSQVSLTVVDPDTGSPIGALTVGVNVEYLQ